MRLFAISDIHNAVHLLREASSLMRRADWVVMAGDITTKGTRSHAAAVLEAAETSNSHILAVHGNMDTIEVVSLLEERGYSLHSHGRVISDVGFFGLGGSSPTPMDTPTEYKEDEIAEFLKRGYEQVSDAPIRVLVTHVPPRGIRDRALWFLRGGSRSVRQFIEENRVDLCITGHIHEARGIERHGRTIVANAGAFRRGCYLWVEIHGGIEVSLGRL
jgi:hypothetical protein